MGKVTRKFIDKKNAVSFHLIHRAVDNPDDDNGTGGTTNRKHKKKKDYDGFDSEDEDENAAATQAQGTQRYYLQPTSSNAFPLPQGFPTELLLNEHEEEEYHSIKNYEHARRKATRLAIENTLPHDYDYNLHLRSISGKGVWLPAMKGKIGNKEPVAGDGAVEEDVRFADPITEDSLNQDVNRTLVEVGERQIRKQRKRKLQSTNEKDFLRSLDDDFEEEYEQNLEDDFVLKAMGVQDGIVEDDEEEMEEDDDEENKDDDEEYVEEYYEEDEEREVEVEEWEEVEDDDNEMEKLQREIGFMPQSAHSRALDEDFERVLREDYEDEEDEEDGDEYDDEDEQNANHHAADLTLTTAELLSELTMEENRKPAQTYLLSEDSENKEILENARRHVHNAVERLQTEEPLTAKEIAKSIDSQFVTVEKEKWDCESIISTYSNVENHPNIIDHRTRSSKTSIKAAKNESFGNMIAELAHRIVSTENSASPTKSLQDVDEEEDDLDEDGEPIDRGIGRPKGETTEEKRLRKAAVKAAAREQRTRKKEMKSMYASMKYQNHRVQVQQQATVNVIKL